MSVYAEAHKYCPKCNKRCTVQLNGVRGEVDQYYLDDPQELASSYTREELLLLEERLSNEIFYCRGDSIFGEKLSGCGYKFTLTDQHDVEKLKIAKRICDGDDE